MGFGPAIPCSKSCNGTVWWFQCCGRVTRSGSRRTRENPGTVGSSCPRRRSPEHCVPCRDRLHLYRLRPLRRSVPPGPPDEDPGAEHVDEHPHLDSSDEVVHVEVLSRDRSSAHRFRPRGPQPVGEGLAGGRSRRCVDMHEMLPSSWCQAAIGSAARWNNKRFCDPKISLPSPHRLKLAPPLRRLAVRRHSCGC